MPDGMVCPVCGSELREAGLRGSEYSNTQVILRACSGCAYREERPPA